MWTITEKLYISDKSVIGLISIGHYCSPWYRIPPSPGPVAALARIPGPPPPSLPASPGKKPRYRRGRSPGSLTALSSPPGGHGHWLQKQVCFSSAPEYLAKCNKWMGARYCLSRTNVQNKWCGQIWFWNIELIWDQTSSCPGQATYVRCWTMATLQSFSWL